MNPMLHLSRSENGCSFDCVRADIAPLIDASRWPNKIPIQLLKRNDSKVIDRRSPVVHPLEFERRTQNNFGSPL